MSVTKNVWITLTLPFSTTRIAFILLIISCSNGYSQVLKQIAGKPIICNYSPKIYQSHQQIWSITQGKNQLMYFGNHKELIVFDGVSWQKIQTPNNQLVHALATDQNGIIYLGLGSDFGYLSINKLGQPQYISLLPKLPKSTLHQFTTIIKIHATNEGVYFTSNEKIFRYRNGRFDKIWTAEKNTLFHSTYYFNDEFYVIKQQKGLYKLQKDNFILVRSFRRKRMPEIYAIIPYSKTKTLVFERHTGIWLYNNQTRQATAFNKTLNKLLGKYFVTSVCKLPNQHFALGTAHQGILIIDAHGNVKHLLTKQQGLISNDISALYYTGENLWAASAFGIIQVIIHSPIHLHDQTTGYQNISRELISYRGKVYISNDQGVFVNSSGKFNKVMGVNGASSKFHLFPVPNSSQVKLLVANIHGVYAIEDSLATRVIPEKNVSLIYSEPTHPQRLYLGFKKGLGIWKYKQGNWIAQTKRFPQFIANITSMGIDQQDRIWFTTSYQGVGFLKNKEITLLDTLFGIRSHALPSLFTYQKKIYFKTENGICVYDEQTKHFKINHTFEKLLGYQGQIAQVLYDSHFRYWVIQDVQTQKWIPFIQQEDKTFIRDSLSLKIVERVSNFMDIMFVDTQGHYWAYTPSLQLFNYSAHRKPVTRISFQALLRKVRTSNDSILFGGFNPPKPSKLSFRHNSITFNYASSYFVYPEHTLYSFQLVGYDQKWSKWSSETKKEYTNLPEGQYTFKVKAKNIYDAESTIAIYYFKIFPPWYHTWWAYTILSALIFISILGIIKVYTYRLNRQKIVLERKVQVRTIEISEKNKEIISQNEELKQQQDEIMAQRDAIESQNKLLNQQNSQIKQSIRSAQTIQAAVLPFASRLTSLLYNYFLIYRPKDIVSGDFFWVGNVNNKRIIGVIDCTGHGVPGAFMSLIGVTLLNEIIKTKQITDPAEILENLRKRIRYVLRQDETGRRNGMDGAFVTLEKNNQTQIKVTFAGAKRPLWHIANGSNQLQIISGSSVSIGVIYRNPRQIVAQTIICESKSFIYLSTDGFADQNDIHRKKLGNDKIIDVLSENSGTPLAQQKQLLETLLAKHMEGTEQRDDILFMGIQV